MRTVIEITDNVVKLVQSRNQAGRPHIVRCIERLVKGNNDAELSRVLLETTRGKSVEPDKLILAIPRRQAIVKRLKLPSTVDAELHKMVGMHVVNQIPFSLEEIIYDYHLIEKDSEGYSHVLAIIIEKKIASRYLSVLKDAGIKSARMTLSSLGILHWGANYVKQSRESAAHPVLFANIDHDHSDIAFIQGDKLLFSRSINYGERDLGSGGISEITRQLQLSISAYKQDKMGADVKKVVLITKALQGEDLCNAVQKQLGCSAVCAQPFEYVGYKKKIFKNNDFSASMAAPLGLLFAQQSRLANLTPAEVHVGKQQTMMRKHWVMYFLLLILLAASAVSVFWIEVNHKEQQYAELEEAGKGYGPRLKRIQQRSEFIKEFSHELSKRIYIPQLIDFIYTQVPEDISFRSIVLDERRQLTLQGYAENGQAISTFQERLVRAPEFHSVSLQFATKRRIFNIEVTDFKIVADLFKEDRNE